MKTKLLIAGLFAGLAASAQKPAEEIADAERRFAAFAVAYNTRDAFLKFADSTGLVYENGKPQNAIALWSKKQKGGGLLNWAPAFAEAATSGDFGYTTGQWTYQAKNLTDTILAQGQFCTIWHKATGGDWKFLLDLGLDSTPLSQVKTFEVIEMPKGHINRAKATYLDAEKDFIRLFKKDKKEAYRYYLSSKSILCRNGYLPALKSAEQKNLVARVPLLGFSIDGSGCASSGDLAYVYGVTMIRNKRDGYLRIWRHEPGGWKIALENLGY